MSLLDRIRRCYEAHNRRHERKLSRLMVYPADQRVEDACIVLRAEIDRLKRQDMETRDQLMQMRRERDGFKAIADWRGRKLAELSHE